MANYYKKVLIIFFPDTKMENLSKQLGGMYEILYYRKNHNGIWLQEEIIPIRNEESIIVLFLVTFRDITPFKGKKIKKKTDGHQ